MKVTPHLHLVTKSEFTRLERFCLVYDEETATHLTGTELHEVPFSRSIQFQSTHNVRYSVLKPKGLWIVKQVDFSSLKYSTKAQSLGNSIRFPSQIVADIAIY